MKLDPFVAQIIAAKNFNHFTTSDVRSEYLSLQGDASLEPSKVRRFIYAQLLKLVKKGWLKKQVPKRNGFTRFHKTELFDPQEIQSELVVSSNSSRDPNSQKHNKLLVKLNHYKAELLLNIGESEAYKELYTEVPELVEDIQPLFNKGKDNNTKILGKIRAIEGLLNQYRASNS
jgi:hypothetical protein